MRILVFSSLFPNAVEAHHGIFVLERLRHLRERHQIRATVVAPVPFFPPLPGFGRWSRLARIPARERIDGFDVWHPRSLVTPKIGMSLYPCWMALGCRRLVRRLQAREPFDLIDAHYVFPDGAAATLIGRKLGLPVVVTARGTDVNLIPRYRLPRAWVRWTLRAASARAAVCAALARAMEELGAPRGSVRVLRNGVDLERFRPQERAAARAEIGQPDAGRLLLSVGHLIERKGHHLVIDALAALQREGLDDLRLLIVGHGPMDESLRRQASRHGLGDRVTFVGLVPHERLAAYYSAADLLVLASSREGWANVLLEAMACGTPVVATRIWGTPEVVSDEDVGLLVEQREVPALAGTIRRAIGRHWDRGRVRRHAEAHSWDATSDGQMELFTSVASGAQERLETEPIEA